MPNNYESIHVGCPFYMYSDGGYIRCEGLVGLTMTILFVDKRRKIAMMERYCNCRWGDCPFYKAVADQYE